MAGIRRAARPRRHFSDTSPALRPFFAQPYTVTAAARQPAYSERSESAGSMRDARRTGINVAKMVTASTSQPETARATGIARRRSRIEGSSGLPGRRLTGTP